MRNKRLDILRAIAILLVLGRHGNGPTLWRSAGWVGVDLFFVLSGFLISGLLFSEYKKSGGIDWGRFFIRRGFKIYPSFYVLILATFLWQLAQRREIRWAPYLPEIFFYQSYQSYRMWGHTWSLAVEEHFYIFLPALLLLLLRFQARKYPSDPFRLIPAVWGTLALYCLLQRSYLAYILPHDDVLFQRVQFPTHLRIDSLCFGALLGYLHHFHALRLREITARPVVRWLLGIVSLLLVSICIVLPVSSPLMLGPGLSAICLGFGGLLILAMYIRPQEASGKQARVHGFGASDPAAYVGMYSYSIYLWHGMVAQHVHGLLQLLWPKIGETAVFWGYVLISLAAGILLSRLIEFPMLHLRDRLFPPRTSLAGNNPRGSETIEATILPDSHQLQLTRGKQQSG